MKRDFDIIYFDGVCNLCNASVDFIIKHDKKRRYRYASLQSQHGHAILNRMNINPDDYDSFILDTGNRVLTKSSAALKVIASFGNLYSVINFLFIVPKPIRDLIYSWIAKNRYKWFGKKETCRLPSPEEKALFL